MSEEQNESTGKSLKNILIGLVSTITLGVGGWVTTKLTGGDDKEAAPVQQVAPIVINNNNSQQQTGDGKTVVIKEKTVEKPAAPSKPKKDGDEFKEKPAQW